MAARFIDHWSFTEPTGNSFHPLAFARQEAVRHLGWAMGWLDDDQIVAAELPPIETLERFHHPDYLTALERSAATLKVSAADRARFGFGTLENPVYPGLFDRARATVGGSIAAARVALGGEVAFHPAGGTHHGKAGRASGFCYFNDPAFAIQTLLDAGAGPVAYLDLDAHHGDGVEQLFAEHRSVQLISIHEDGRWPHSGTAAAPGPGNAVNIAVPKGFNDSELERLMTGPVADAVARFRPCSMVVTAGADCLHGDPLSSMELSNRALWRAVEMAIGWTDHCVVLGGGGYNPWTVARGWAGLWALLSGRQADSPPTEEALRLLASYRSDLIDNDEIDPEWLVSIADRPRPGPLRREIESAVAALRCPAE